MSVSKNLYTRKSVECPIFGSPKDFDGFVLPTYQDVIKCFLLVRYELKPPDSKKEPTVSEICEILADKITMLWRKATIPIVSRTRVIQCIRTYHDKYLKLIRYPNSKRNDNYILRVKDFQNNGKTLFDICTCKCETFEKCLCEKGNKVLFIYTVYLIIHIGTNSRTVIFE